jgi:hypothetical protein
MKRPSFQFYPGDWRSNAKLRRCTDAERGIWIEVMCLLHDSEEYGVLRWPLKDVAQAIGCKLLGLRALSEKGVLKGADTGSQCEPYVYTPRHAGKDGTPVILVPGQVGPIWFSSRMVCDEYLRTTRGVGTRFGETPKSPPTHREGDGASSSSSASISNISKESKPLSGKPDAPPGFVRFWTAWPKTERKQGKSKCLAIWKRKALESKADDVLAHVEKMARSESWKGGYDPMPTTYLNGERWDGADLETPTNGEKHWWETASGIKAKGAAMGLHHGERESFPEFKGRVLNAAGEGPWSAPA